MKAGAGRYKNRLEIQRNEPRTVNRQRVDNWVPYCTRYGSLKPIRAVERYIATSNNEVLISHTIRLRFDSKTRLINEGFRVKYHPDTDLPERYFAVESVIDPDERRKEIELHVVERSFER